MTESVSGLDAALFRDEEDDYIVVEMAANKGACFVRLSGAPSLEIVVSGLSTPLSVGVVGDAVTVNSATDGSGDATSTMAEIVAAVNADVDAKLLLLGRLSPGSTGAGVPGAFSSTSAADGVAFTDASLVDSGDHLTFQAAAGSRYWDEGETLTVYDNAMPVTSGFTVNHLRGSVTFEASKSGHTITATGTRRSEYALQKVMGLFDGKLKINGTDIDTTSVDDDGWGSSIGGSSKWELTAGHFFYAGDIALDQFKLPSLWKFYSEYSAEPYAIGKGILQNIEDILASTNDAQKQNITVKGDGEIYLE